MGRILASFAAAGWYLWMGRRTVEASTEHDQGSKIHGNETLKEQKIDETYIQQELKQLTRRLETRAAEKTAELIATGAGLETPAEMPLSDRDANATTVQDEIGDFAAY